jgi:hypothetical protein
VFVVGKREKKTQKCVEIKLFCFPKEKERKRKISEKTMEGGLNDRWRDE